MAYIFGPVPSRRLGLSLGIDLIPPKTCTFDCLYCQVGRTSLKTLETKPFVPVHEVIEEVKNKLLMSSPDAITLGGSGEPTLYSEIDRVIVSTKEMTKTKVALLTNGSLFWRKDIRKRVLGADIIMPTLSTALERTFSIIHRPHPELELSKIIDGLKMLRKEYKGQLFLEVVLLAGINDTEVEMEGLKTVVEEISPEKVQLNTVVRPPADSKAIPLDRKRLEEIKIFLGEKAEIVAEVPLTGMRGTGDSLVSGLMDMIKRRPLGPADIAKAFSLSMDEVEELVKGLIIKGCIRKQEHLGKIYYLSNERDIH